MFCKNCGNELGNNERFCTSCGTENTNTNEIKNETARSINKSVSDGLNVEYIGFFPRLFAYLMDILFIIVLSFIAGSIFGSLGLLTSDTANLLGLIIAILYFSIQESSAKQATFGKQIMGIKVVDENLHRISFGRAVGRYFGRILSGIILCIGYIMIFFTQRKQALHDKIVSTLVIKA